MSAMQEKCPICKTDSDSIDVGGYDGIERNCPRCGKFRMTGTAKGMNERLRDQDRIKLSGWVREQNMLGTQPEINSYTIKNANTIPMPGLIERADRLLSFAVRNNPAVRKIVKFFDPAYIAVSYSKDREEVDFLLGYLHERGFIENRTGGGHASISFQGHVHFEGLQARQAISSQAFVAMWFDESMNDVYQRGFELGIRAAGYDPVRVDQTEHIGKIDDEIIAQIRRSRFIVADFTGHRGGVYFEAGYAQGLNLPVIWTCRDDDIGNLHFDIRQFNCIDWRSPDDLAKRLQLRIEVTIGDGPRKHPLTE